jgi:hypothetical protein
VSLLNYDEGLRASPHGKLMVGLIPLLKEDPDMPGWSGESSDILRLRQLMIFHESINFGASCPGVQHVLIMFLVVFCTICISDLSQSMFIFPPAIVMFLIPCQTLNFAC